MKRYLGFAGVGPGLVVVEEGGDQRPLRHHVRHSPDGFTWGYHGSGPSELARCMLWDALGKEPSPADYQDFKREWVATWPQDQPFDISAETILGWLRTRRP